MSAPRLRGAIVWAVVPYVPQAPFRLSLGDGHRVATIPDAATYARQARSSGLDPEQTFLVEGKLRTVVLLQDRPARRLREIVALRMIRLEALEPGQREAIRQHREPSLFYLPVRPAKYGPSKETAVDLDALVRVHVSAMLPRAVGALDDSEMRVIGQRLAAHLDIDLEPLIAAGVEQRLDELTRPPD